MSLAGKTILMSGGSRGIGLAIALRAAADGANIAMLAKTDTPHPKLEGTVHTAAEQIREAGGQALPIVGDVRDDSDITEAVLKTQGEFGGIDIVINNASVIDLSRSLELSAQTGYTLAKFGMTMATLGLAAEFASDGIAANTLWPRTTIATAAVQNLLGGDKVMAASRTADIYADAAYAVLLKPAAEYTGQSLIVEDVLEADGVTDFSRYAAVPGTPDD